MTNTDDQYWRHHPDGLISSPDPDDHCNQYLTHVVDYEQVDLQPDLSYIEQPVEIMDRKEQVLRNKVIGLVKVLWQNHNVEESTWELESTMQEKYTHLFSTWFRDEILLRRGDCNNPNFWTTVQGMIV